MPEEGFKVAPSARDETQKRVRKVKRFFHNPSTHQVLRRSNLVLQLTSRIEAFMSNIPAEDEPPKVVELLREKAHEELNMRLQHLLMNLGKDPQLNQAGAATVLFATAANLAARLDLYVKYPLLFARMCRRWFPGSHQHAITAF